MGVIAKLPVWALYGGVVLAFVAGMVNAAGYLGLHHQAVTHMTGTVTLLGLAVVEHEVADLVYFGIMLLAFVTGCALSGFIIGDTALQAGRRYGVVLIIESLLLFTAVLWLRGRHDTGLWLAAAAAGMQNAMAATYSGAVVRTTHMSGIITDLGTFLGQWVRGDGVNGRRVVLYVGLLAGFVSGGAVAAVMWPRLEGDVLLAPAVVTGVVGVGHALWRYRKGVAGSG